MKHFFLTFIFFFLLVRPLFSFTPSFMIKVNPITCKGCNTLKYDHLKYIPKYFDIYLVFSDDVSNQIASKIANDICPKNVNCKIKIDPNLFKKLNYDFLTIYDLKKSKIIDKIYLTDILEYLSKNRYNFEIDVNLLERKVLDTTKVIPELISITSYEKDVYVLNKGEEKIFKYSHELNQVDEIDISSLISEIKKMGKESYKFSYVINTFLYSENRFRFLIQTYTTNYTDSLKQKLSTNIGYYVFYYSKEKLDFQEISFANYEKYSILSTSIIPLENNNFMILTTNKNSKDSLFFFIRNNENILRSWKAKLPELNQKLNLYDFNLKTFNHINGYYCMVFSPEIYHVLEEKVYKIEDRTYKVEVDFSKMTFFSDYAIHSSNENNGIIGTIYRFKDKFYISYIDKLNSLKLNIKLKGVDKIYNKYPCPCLFVLSYDLNYICYVGQDNFINILNISSKI